MALLSRFSSSRSPILLLVLVLLECQAGFGQTGALAPGHWDPLTGRLTATPEAPASPARRAVVLRDTAMSATVHVSWSQFAPQEKVPSPRDCYAMTEGPGNTCLLFGGSTGGGIGLNDLYQISQDGRWTLLSPQGTPPSPRNDMAGVYDSPGARMVIFGGFSGSSTFFNDTWALDTNTCTWTPLLTQGTAPSPRRSHTAVFDKLRRRMVVFGGTPNGYGTAVFNDLYTLDLATTPTWSRLFPTGDPLPAVRAHTATYIPDKDAMVIFGGDNEKEIFFNDLYLVSFAGNTVERLATTGTPHPPVIGATSFYDPRAQRLFIFGGMMQDRTRAGLSVLSMQTRQWETIDAGPTAPPLRHWMQMGMLASPDKFLLFGGLSTSTTFLNDSWLLTLDDPAPIQMDIKDFLIYE